MKQCNKCKEDLVLGTNWRECNKKNQQYTCKGCMYKSARKWELDNPIRRTELFNSWRTKKQGVYEIFSGDICLYIGESGQINHRMETHKSMMRHSHLRKHSNGFYKVYEKMDVYDNKDVRILEECDNHKERETHWINKLKPLFNKKSIS